MDRDDASFLKGRCRLDEAPSEGSFMGDGSIEFRKPSQCEIDKIDEDILQMVKRKERQGKYWVEYLAIVLLSFSLTAAR